MDRRLLSATIFLIGCATLILEIAITRLFSVLMYYHFAFMAISVALFGIGASGLYIFIFQERFTDKTFASNLAVACTFFAITIPLGLVAILRMPITIDYSSANVIRLIGIYIVALIPFFCAGFAISLILFKRAADVSRLYFFDLVGAACGALIAVPLLDWIGPINAQLLAAALGAAGALLAAYGLRPRMKWLAIATTGGMLVLLAANTQFQMLDLQYLKGEPKRNVTLEKWNSCSHVVVREFPDQPGMAAIDIDANARTYIINITEPLNTISASRIKNSLAAQWIGSAPYEVAGRDRVLIIGPGGGIDVLFALAWGSRHIDAVEINPIIANTIMRDRYAEYSGRLYERPEVDVTVAEGRSFVRRSTDDYDLIQLTLVDTWAASAAGAFSLSENYLYTTEAFVDYMEHLKPDGYLAISRWLFPRSRQTLRLMTTAMEAAEKLGIDKPEQHICVVAARLPGSNLNMATFMFKRSPLTRDDVLKLNARARLADGGIVYSPFESADNQFFRLAEAVDRAAFIRDYEFDIEPATDNRPFFFNTFKSVDLGRILKLESESQKNNLGIFSLFVVTVLSAVLVLLFFVVPLVWARRGRTILRTGYGLRLLLFFVAIGLGFILIEIALMQKFILYLGHPVYSLAVVLACLLVSAGLGSYYTKRFDHKTSRRYGMKLYSAIVGLLAVEWLIIPAVFEATFTQPMPVRIGVCVLLLGPLGFLMGQPFPIELKYVNWRCREIIPWAWGLNGAASVLASTLAVAMGMAWGFNAVIGIGACCYIAAATARIWNTRKQ